MNVKPYLVLYASRNEQISFSFQHFSIDKGTVSRPRSLPQATKNGEQKNRFPFANTNAGALGSRTMMTSTRTAWMFWTTRTPETTTVTTRIKGSNVIVWVVLLVPEQPTKKSRKHRCEPSIRCTICSGENHVSGINHHEPSVRCERSVLARKGKLERRSLCDRAALSCVYYPTKTHSVFLRVQRKKKIRRLRKKLKLKTNSGCDPATRNSIFPPQVSVFQIQTEVWSFMGQE